ncbi:MAG: hypothetical protein FWH05_00825 [Oscillospiraceae bacterium]|nr:hypothetical protein [Oscillospiraceae bacterium]
MKKIALIVAVMMSCVACRANVSTYSDTPIETQETVTEEVLETQPPETEELETEIDEVEIEETDELEIETEESGLPEIPPIDINMTDEEVYELAMKRGDELSRLFLDFLNISLRHVSFSCDYKDRKIGEYVYYFGDVGQHEFFKVNHDTIKTYNDLLELFNKTCTPEYTEFLLKHASHQFTDIDGEIYFFETMLTRMVRSDEEVVYNSFEVQGDEIKLNFTVNMNNHPEGNSDWYIDYSIFLKNIDGEWLVSGCTDVHTHGYEWFVEYDDEWLSKFEQDRGEGD